MAKKAKKRVTQKKPKKEERFWDGKIPEVKASLKMAWESGCSNKQACDFAGISIQSLRRYWVKHPEFKAERLRLKSMINVQSKICLYNGVQRDPALAFKVLQVKERAEYGPQVGIIKADLTGETLTTEEIENLKSVLIQEDIDFDETELIEVLQEPDKEGYDDEE